MAATQGTAILSQIEGLIEHYIALGEGTPAFDRAHQWLEEVRSSLQEARSDRTEAAGPDEPLGTHPAAGDGIGAARKHAMADIQASGGSMQSLADSKKKKKAKAY